jgi:hypothetical protein
MVVKESRGQPSAPSPIWRPLNLRGQTAQPEITTKKLANNIKKGKEEFNFNFDKSYTFGY